MTFSVRETSPSVRVRLAPSVVERLSEPEEAEATEHRLQRFGPWLALNPRSMERFINDYSIVEAVRLLEGSSVGGDSRVLWTIIETRWPVLADYLPGNPEAMGSVGDSCAPLGPSDVAGLFNDPDVCRVVQFEHGGSLTCALIRTCCGAQGEG